MPPSGESMDPPQSFDNIYSGTKIQMVGIDQENFCAHLFQIVSGERLDRPLGPDRHKDRRLDHPVRGRQPSQAGIAVDMR